MRAAEFTESHYEVMQPLKKMVDHILNNLSERVELYSVVRQPFSKKFIQEFEDNPRYLALAEYINKNVPISFVNKKSNLGGAYSHGATPDDDKKDQVVVFLKNPLGDNKVQKPSDIAASKKIQTTLLHELRHVMQRQEYKEYYHKIADKHIQNDQRDEKDKTPFMSLYRKDPVEIDAAFFHHLNDEENTDDVQSFVDGVMSRFEAYKDLTPKWKKHYRRKAAKYYYDTIAKDDTLGKSTPKDRLDKKRENNKNKLVSYIQDYDSEKFEDLRNIGHPEEGSFFFPGHAARNGLSMWIQGKEPSEFNKIIMTLFAALVHLDNDDFPVNEIDNHINFPVEDTIDWIKSDKFHEAKKYNRKFMLKAMKKLQAELE